METEGSLPHLKEHATCPYPEPHIRGTNQKFGEYMPKGTTSMETV
jgi:hypothetical protein